MMKRTWGLMRSLALLLFVAVAEAVWTMVTTGTRSGWVIAGNELSTLVGSALLWLAYIGLRRALAAYDRWRW